MLPVIRRSLIAFAILLAAPAALTAEEYPSDEITLVAPYGVGGAADRHARVIARTAPSYLGQSIKVINKTGAAGVVGSSYVVRAGKDGYTLLSARVGSQASVPAINSHIPYKWDDFTFIGLTERNPFVIVVPYNSRFKNFNDLEKSLRYGAPLSYSTAGTGTLLHLATLVMADSLGIAGENLVHIPYKGGGKARDAVIAGLVDMTWQNLSAVIQAIKDKKVRALAVTTETRSNDIPDVPTVRELGFRRMEMIIGWSGIFGPPDLPEPVLRKWVETLKKLKNDKTFNTQIRSLGSIPDVRSPAETKKFVESQYRVFKQVAIKLGLSKPD